MSKKVLTVGEILVEIVATTKGDGFREPQPLVGPFPSGAPAIFIDQVGRLGSPAAIVSRVGATRRDACDSLQRHLGKAGGGERGAHDVDVVAAVHERLGVAREDQPLR